jgi:hypothetical protein
VISWLTFLLGIAVSIAGNIGHAASDGMRPGEWLGAAFWPLALMLSIEILTRVRWQPEKRWALARFAALVLVSIVAAILSYLHLRSLMLFWGEAPFQATIGPLAVDGLMLMAASALLSISKERPEITVLDAVGRESPHQVYDWEPEPDPVDAEIEQLLTVVDKPKVQTSSSVSMTDAEEAAFQAWSTAPADAKPSVRKLATVAGISPSKAHRLISNWKNLETVR